MGNFDRSYPEANQPDRGQDGRKGCGDDGGARVGKPDAGSTGAGAEATRGTDGEAEGHEHEHESGYGGKGGEPKKPNK